MTPATCSPVISEGVPPPKKIEATCRSPVRPRQPERSSRMARYSGSVSRAFAAYTLKSQYGQMRAQYGQWT